ncbi:hypothetical protein CEXT_210211 [Caerostris extrusa]|uniref:Uncharacterized protein n=1 Tax=Caerostris extrusa TaxID=172846 RepID=A0AAV4XMW9_CAEEX|nr:hypothetical protein CEXT_210211 [Caerostris extrusa]
MIIKRNSRNLSKQNSLDGVEICSQYGNRKFFSRKPSNNKGESSVFCRKANVAFPPDHSPERCLRLVVSGGFEKGPPLFTVNRCVRCNRHLDLQTCFSTLDKPVVFLRTELFRKRKGLWAISSAKTFVLCQLIARVFNPFRKSERDSFIVLSCRESSVFCRKANVAFPPDHSQSGVCDWLSRGGGGFEKGPPLVVVHSE